MKKLFLSLSILVTLVYAGVEVANICKEKDIRSMYNTYEALVEGESVGVVENKQLRITKILRETEIEVDLSITTTGAELKTTYGNTIKGFWQGCKRSRNSQCDQSQEKYVAL